MRAGAVVLGVVLAGLVGGCAAIHPFPTAARPGETIALAVGWNKTLSRQDATITIAPSAGQPIVLPPSDPAIRAVLRLYPDPASRLVVGTETQQGLDVNAQTYGDMVLEQVTAQDRDWWLTTVYLDLPSSLPPGYAAITVAGTAGPVMAEPAVVEILPGVGTPARFAGPGVSVVQSGEFLAALERAQHFTVSFSGSVVPHAVSLELTRTPGVGKPWLVNPRGDLKNLAWSDDGTQLKVLLTPSHGQALPHLADFKFYVAGGLAGIQVKQLKAYDVQGKPVPGISAAIE
jgi:hypothetical protein